MMDTSARNKVLALTEGLNIMASSTITPAPVATTEREHLSVLEIETESGYRFWTAVMPESEASAYAKDVDANPNQWLSEFVCASSCWCH